MYKYGRYSKGTYFMVFKERSVSVKVFLMKFGEAWRVVSLYSPSKLTEETKLRIKQEALRMARITKTESVGGRR